MPFDVKSRGYGKRVGGTRRRKPPPTPRQDASGALHRAVINAREQRRAYVRPQKVPVHNLSDAGRLLRTAGRHAKAAPHETRQKYAQHVNRLWDAADGDYKTRNHDQPKLRVDYRNGFGGGGYVMPGSRVWNLGAQNLHGSELSDFAMVNPLHEWEHVAQVATGVERRTPSWRLEAGAENKAIEEARRLGLRPVTSPQYARYVRRAYGYDPLAQERPSRAEIRRNDRRAAQRSRRDAFARGVSAPKLYGVLGYALDRRRRRRL